MKRLIFLLCILCAATGIYFLISQTETVLTPLAVSTPTPTSSPSKPTQTIMFNAHQFAYGYFVVSDHSHIHLIPNFETPTDAETLVKDNACTHAINAGFYSKNNKPIGLWKNENGVSGTAETNALLNGFYSIYDTEPTISYDAPSQSRIAFQTGPILTHDGETIKLAIKNDEPARRMVAGTTKDGSSVFLTVYDPLSPLRGPYLNDLPTIIQLIAIQMKTGFVSAINLDGGSASAFYSDGIGIWELNPVGSLLCVR
jgi:exopolysaccharide biosynthesis protein